MNDTIVTKIIFLSVAVLIIITIFVPAKKNTEKIAVKAANSIVNSDERFDITK